MSRTLQANRAARLSEADIERTCCELLELDGWRRLKTDPVSDMATVNAIRRAIVADAALKPVLGILHSLIARCLRGKGFGEAGMADDLFIRYDRAMPSRGEAEVLWIEWKQMTGIGRPTKAAVHQVKWHAAERALGALTLIAGVDFEASIEGFQSWYLASGFNRRLREAVVFHPETANADPQQTHQSHAGRPKKELT